MNARWYEEFFRGIVLDMWRKAVTPEQTRAEADFLERRLELRPGARLLDVPCGSGRHAIELASRGYHMTGVDLSPESIQDARRLTADLKPPVNWICADMRELPGNSEFDGAYCFGNSFGYLEPAAMKTFVGAVSRALRPGARFVLDTGMAAESILPNLQERQWMRIDDIWFLEENRYLVPESCYETTYTFIRGGEAHVGTGLHWVYTIRELRSLLEDAGLLTDQMLSSLEGEPYRVGCPYLLLVTHKE